MALLSTSCSNQSPVLFWLLGGALFLSTIFVKAWTPQVAPTRNKSHIFATSASPSEMGSAAWSSMPLLQLVLLDRDGVLNEDVGSPGVVRPDQLKLTPGAGQAVGKLCRHNLTVAMVTNQSCVGKGLIDLEELETIQSKVQELLRAEDSDARLDKIYQCTSTKEEGDFRMKPQPGMILEALSDFGIEPAAACFIGDTSTDLQAASAAGIERRILVATGYGQGLMSKTSISDPGRGRLVTQQGSEGLAQIVPEAFPFLFFSNLASAVDFLLSRIPAD